MGRTLGSDVGATVLNQDIYEISATQKHRLGTRVKRGNRTFYYGKVMATMVQSSYLAASYYHQDIMYAAIATASPIGSNLVYVTVGVADGIANDGAFAAHSLEGGNIVIFDATGAECFNFGILDNNAAVSGGTITITLDGELPVATVITTWHVEAMGSPYRVTSAVGSGNARCFMGLPMRMATTTYPYVWLQTWGPCFVAPQSTVGSAQRYCDVIANADGTLDVPLYTDDNRKYAQKVGFVMTWSQTGTQGAPFIMLQIAP